MEDADQPGQVAQDLNDRKQPSRSFERDPDATYHTPDTLEDALLAFMKVDELGRRVKIVDSVLDLDKDADIQAFDDNGTVAWASQIASNYPAHKKILITHAYMYNDDTRYDWAVYGTTQTWNPHNYGPYCP